MGVGTTRPARRLLERAHQVLRSIPVQVRLVAILLAVLLAALTATTLATALLMRRDLVAQLDRDLGEKAAPVANTALRSIQQDTVSELPTGYAVVFVPADGSSPRGVYSVSQKDHPDIPWLPVDDPLVVGNTPFTVGSVDGDTTWRVMPGHLRDYSASYFVAVPLTQVDKTVQRLVLVAGLIGWAVLLTTGLTGYMLTRRAFRPLREIEATAAGIAAGDLGKRVPERPGSGEVASLSRSLNHMLARIERSFDAQAQSEARMRQFIADASHELRTPLVTVKGYAELYRAGGITKPEDVATAMGRIEGEASRMHTLVEDLLQLARLDDDRPMEWHSVDLTVLANDVVQDARVRDPERAIRLLPLSEHLTPVDLQGDEAKLRQVLTNLVGNALGHTAAGTPVEVLVGVVDEGRVARVVVRDHGEGIEAADIDRVFERFFRSDAGRSRGRGGGSGLGLAIVAAIVAAHRGRVRASHTDGGGATFTVDLPTVRPDAQ